MKRTEIQMVVLVLSMFFWGCSDQAPLETGDTIRPAKLVEVRTGSGVRTVSFPAVIEAATSADVTFQVGGLLQELPVREGQSIQRGELIARLDQRSLRNQVATAQAQFDEAESSFQRAQRLLAENATSRRDFEQRKSAREVARSALDIARKQLEDATLRSPFAGVVAVVHAEKFQTVAPQEPIVTVQAVGAAEAAVQIPATLVATSGRFEAEDTVVILDAAPEDRIPASIQSSSTRADSETQTFLVRFAFASPDDLVVLPGMTGTIHSTLRSLGDGAVNLPAVPLAAVLSDGDSRYVWVVDKASMVVSRRDVTVAPGAGNSLTISEGLKEGEVIVGAGASYLHQGMKIRPFEP